MGNWKIQSKLSPLFPTESPILTGICTGSESTHRSKLSSQTIFYEEPNFVNVVFDRQGLPENTRYTWEETWLIEKDVIKPQRFKEENNSYYLKKIE